MDAQTLTIIVTLAGLMIGLTRTNTKHLEQRIDSLATHTDQRIDSLATHTDQRIDSLERNLTGRIDGLEAEIGALRATVLTMDGRLYDLATGRHAPLIIPSR